MTAVWLSMAVNLTALVVVYPPFKGINSPRFGIVKDTVQYRDGL